MPSICPPSPRRMHWHGGELSSSLREVCLISANQSEKSVTVQVPAQFVARPLCCSRHPTTISSLCGIWRGFLNKPNRKIRNSLNFFFKSPYCSFSWVLVVQWDGSHDLVAWLLCLSLSHTPFLLLQIALFRLLLFFSPCPPSHLLSVPHTGEHLLIYTTSARSYLSGFLPRE